MTAASASTDARTLDVISPLDGALIDRVPATSPEEIDSLVHRARDAQAAWAATPIRDRVRVVERIRDAFLARGPELAELLHRENGKSGPEAMTSEIIPSVALFDYWTGAAPRLLKPERVSIDPLQFPGKRGVIEYEPRGVAALITPWNYPVSIPLRALVPALLAGNAVVWKPSEFSPLTGKAVFDIFAAELPKDVVVLVQGDGAVGQALVDAPIDFVSFTGSAATGRRIAARTAERLIPVSLELGGKNAAVVLEDAELDRTAAGLVWGAFANAGQNCAAVSRIFVAQGIADELEQRMRAFASTLRTGPGAEHYEVGPLVHARQLAQVERHVGEATAAGTQVLAGGDRIDAPGHWFKPTIIREPAANLAITREETFGPAVAIVPVADEEEAIRRANDSEFGLTASIWTRDLARGERLARRIDVGTVTINNTSFTPAIPNAPWSGRRLSGTGTTNSHRALSEMVRTRFILVDRSRVPEVWWFPHDASLVRLSRTLPLLLRRGIFAKLAALPRLLPLLMARSKTLKSKGLARTSR